MPPSRKYPGSRRPMGPPTKNKPTYAPPGGKRPNNVKRPQNGYNRGPPPNSENRGKPTQSLRRPDGRPPKPYQNNVNQQSYNKNPNLNQIPHGKNNIPAPHQTSSWSILACFLTLTLNLNLRSPLTIFIIERLDDYTFFVLKSTTINKTY